MIKLTCVSKELLEEIIEKIGSFAIVDCKVNKTKFEDGDSLYYDIKFDSGILLRVIAVWNNGKGAVND